MEEKRSKKVVEKQAHRVATTVPFNQEEVVPSQPLTSINTNIIERKKLGKSDYSTTTYHQSYAIKCKPSSAISQEVKDSRPSAHQNAILQSEISSAKLKAKFTNTQFNREKADARYESAVSTLAIKKNREIMIKTLHGLQLDDLKRRQEIAMKQTVPPRGYPRQKAVTKVFEERFVDRGVGQQTRQLKSKKYTATPALSGKKSNDVDVSEDSIGVIRF